MDGVTPVTMMLLMGDNWGFFWMMIGGRVELLVEVAVGVVAVEVSCDVLMMNCCCLPPMEDGCRIRNC